VSSWLPGGDLLAATWMGNVVRFNAEMEEKWRTNFSAVPALARSITSAPAATLSSAASATSRITSWVNAEPKPWPLTPNLLDANNVNVEVFCGTARRHLNDEGLFDGLGKPPEQPRLDWHEAESSDGVWCGSLSLVFDTLRTQFRVEAITLVEDPAHPESWIRDARLEYWDAAKSQWVFSQYLTSDSPVHTHKLVKPIEARKFRLAKPDGAGWGTGNLRLAQVVFHGQNLGCSHPEAQANRPVAVLFDEEKSFMPQGFEWRTGSEAASGAHYLALKGDAGASLLPDNRFAQQVTDWDFEIVEKPEKPGQYRWLQFSCKALSPGTRGCSLILGYTEADAKYYPKFLSKAICIDVGDSKTALPFPREQLPDKLTTDWTDVRVDLWALIQKLPERERQSFRVRAFNLMAAGGGAGGGAAFDRILLGRTEADLKASQPIKH